LAAVVTVVVGDPRASSNFRADGVAALADVANWRFLLRGHSYVDLFSAPSALQHYWALSVEEQFYFVLAPLIVVCMWLGRRSRGRLSLLLGGLAAASFVDGWFAVGHGVDRAYYGTDTRALEFLVGALVAVWLTGRTFGRVTSRIVAGGGMAAVA